MSQSYTHKETQEGEDIHNKNVNNYNNNVINDINEEEFINDINKKHKLMKTLIKNIKINPDSKESITSGKSKSKNNSQKGNRKLDNINNNVYNNINDIANKSKSISNFFDEHQASKQKPQKTTQLLEFPGRPLVSGNDLFYEYNNRNSNEYCNRPQFSFKNENDNLNINRCNIIINNIGK